MATNKTEIETGGVVVNTEEQAPADNPTTTDAVTGPTPQQAQKNLFIIWVVAILVVVAVVLAITLSGKEDEEEEELPTSFGEGVSLITYYGVETVVRSRLARTTVTIEAANGLDCSAIHSITLQLPRFARVTSLETITQDCTTTGEVQKLEDARETFLETVAQGLPGAYIEEQDSYTHGVQVAIPPLGTTQVKLVLEELFQQRLRNVEFQMPLAPNEEIDQIVFDLKVEDLTGGSVDFHLDLASNIIDKGDILHERFLELANNTNTSEIPNIVLKTGFHLEIPNTRNYELPKMLRGWYQPVPGDSPDETTAVKTALANFIGTLTDQDSFSIQTYGKTGRADLWGPLTATSEHIQDALLFIDAIAENSRGRGVDLQSAFVEALLRAQRDADLSQENTASILVATSAHAPSVGETDRAKIATNIYKLNEDGDVKIFTLGFPQARADMELLEAIALVNGGVSASIVYGSDYTFESQISTFLENELGSILLADVNVEVAGSDGVSVYGETQRMYPLLADGSEVVVRGLIEAADGTDATDLRVSTTASTISGVQPWEVPVTQDFYSSSANDGISLCIQSYAHERITQLLKFRDAAKFMESNAIEALVNLVDDSCDTTKLPECLEAEALKLAIEANVVVKDLTAMVTIDDQQCLNFEKDNEVCLNGSTPDGSTDSDSSVDDESYDEPPRATYGPTPSPESGGASACMVTFDALLLWVGFQLLMIYIII